MTDRKNLANCKPTEFFRQTVAIKKAAEGWMKATKILDIFRSPVPYKTLPENATAEEKVAIIQENKIIEQDEGMRRISKLFDMAIEKNPEKTLEIMALCCFVDPDKVDDHPISWYMESIMELYNSKVVKDFFTSSVNMGQMSMRSV